MNLLFCVDNIIIGQSDNVFIYCWLFGKKSIPYFRFDRQYYKDEKNLDIILAWLADWDCHIEIGIRSESFIAFVLLLISSSVPRKATNFH